MTLDPGHHAVVLETSRMWLRELTFDDVQDLHEVLGDPVSMRFYSHPFSREEVIGWIEWARRSYAELGHGLWGLALKESGELVGDCGLVVQTVDGERLVEVGYHVKPSHQRQGLATEAALASRDHAFQALGVGRLIALVRVDNEPSAGVARNLGMTVWKETIRAGSRHYVYSIDRDRWATPVDEGTRSANAC
jgi:RimJ/RimL family protein N-acetyltransferase